VNWITIPCGTRDVTGSGGLCSLVMVSALLEYREIQCDSTGQFARIFLFFPNLTVFL